MKRDNIPKPLSFRSKLMKFSQPQVSISVCCMISESFQTLSRWPSFSIILLESISKCLYCRNQFAKFKTKTTKCNSNQTTMKPMSGNVEHFCTNYQNDISFLFCLGCFFFFGQPIGEIITSCMKYRVQTIGHYINYMRVHEITKPKLLNHYKPNATTSPH